jgi:hypothetical protein
MLQVEIDTAALERAATNTTRQLSFAAALTRTAQEAREKLRESLPRALDPPTKFTERGTTINSANNSDLEAFVLFAQIQSQYLEIHETSGTKTAKRGEPINALRSIKA